MKYILLGLAFLIPSVSFAATFNNNLFYGMQNSSDVTQLQEFLTAQGDYSGPITGNFYSLTLAGVKAFQIQNSIQPVSGYFGILSRGVANTLLAPVAPIEETGTTTQQVVQLPASVMQPIPVTIVGNTTPVQTPVVQSPPVDNTQQTPQTPATPAWTIKITTQTQQTSGQPWVTVADGQPIAVPANTGTIHFQADVYDSKGVYTKQAVTVTTDDPDLPSTFTINAPSQVQFFCVAPAYDGFPNQGCKNPNPVTPGTYTVTFTVDDVSVSRQITIQ